MTRLIKYIIFSLLFTNMAAAQIDIPITPPVNPPRTPVDPPGPREPISVRPDPSRPGGGDFDGKYYEYCGPSWLGYKCNFLRSDGVAKMRDVSNTYKAKQVSSYQKEMDAATANVDRDLASLREGLVSPDSEEGKHIRAKLDAAKGLKANAAAIDNATLQFQETATTDIDSTVDVSFGLAYKDSDKKDYEPQASKVNLVIGERFIKSKIKREQERADAIESQIKNGLFANKDGRLAMVNSSRVALEISAQSLQQGDVATSNFALKVGTVFLDTAISVTPVLGWAKDGWEAVTGRNLLTGEKLSGFERSMAVVGVLTAGIGSKLAIAGKAAVLVDVLRAGKAAEESADVAKVASRAAEIAEAAAKAGVKEKSIIDEVAAAVKEGLPCKLASSPLSIKRILLSLVEDTAYAANCIPGSGEEIVKEVFDAAAKYKFDASTLKRGNVGDQVLVETLTSKGNLTSAHTLTTNEALDAGAKWVGDGYKEIGQTGSGVFRSQDGLRQFRMDNGSIAGAHAPGVPHVHFETYRFEKTKFEANNHVPIKD